MSHSQVRINDILSDILFCFVGGIGSYKLYVMVAFILQHVPATAIESQETPDYGFVLLSFFQYFGQYKNWNEYTMLSVVNTKALNVDFNRVFKLKECRDYFHKAYISLSRHDKNLEEISLQHPAIRNRLSNTFLGQILPTDTLNDIRKWYQSKCTNWILRHYPDFESQSFIDDYDEVQISECLEKFKSHILGLSNLVTIEKIKQCDINLFCLLAKVAKEDDEKWIRIVREVNLQQTSDRLIDSEDRNNQKKRKRFHNNNNNNNNVNMQLPREHLKKRNRRKKRQRNQSNISNSNHKVTLESKMNSLKQKLMKKKTNNSKKNRY